MSNFDYIVATDFDRAWLNFELDLEIYNDPFAAQVNAAIDTGQRHRVTLAELDHRSFLIVLRDAAARLLLPYL